MRLPNLVKNRMAENVARGARRLDHRRPNWYRQIDVRRLSLAQGCNCIIGQLYGDYDEEYLRRVINNLSTDGDVFESASNSYGFALPALAAQWTGFGFSGGRWNAVWRELDRLWIAEIEKRREADAQQCAA